MSNENLKQCPNCGADLVKPWLSCPVCGYDYILDSQDDKSLKYSTKELKRRHKKAKKQLKKFEKQIYNRIKNTREADSTDIHRLIFNEISGRILSKMHDHNLETLTIERKYLMEFIGKTLVETDKDFIEYDETNLPFITEDLKKYLEQKGIKTNYEGNLVKFKKLK